jgi:hypothetical protein
MCPFTSIATTLNNVEVVVTSAACSYRPVKPTHLFSDSVEVKLFAVVPLGVAGVLDNVRLCVVDIGEH